jgi:hypothetical protein
MGDGEGAGLPQREPKGELLETGEHLDLPAPEPFAEPIDELELDAPPAVRESQPIVPDMLEADARVLADYGPVPSNIVGTVPYAVLVVTRQRALRKALVDFSRLRASAARDVDETLLELGRALYEKRPPELEQELAQADDTSRVADERNQEWKKAREATAAQRLSLAAKIEEAERAAAPYRDRETKLATQMNVRQTDLRRAKALLSRAQIEQRNAKSSAQRDPNPGGTEPRVVPHAREELLAADVAAKSAEAERTQAKVDELAPELAEARRELAAKVAAINELNEQKKAMETAHKSSEKMHVSSTGEAEKRFHEVLRTLASSGLARGIADDADPEKARSAVRMRAALATRERELKLHERALGMYDKRSFHKGAALIGGAAFLILAMLIFLIVR